MEKRGTGTDREIEYSTPDGAPVLSAIVLYLAPLLSPLLPRLFLTENSSFHCCSRSTRAAHPSDLSFYQEDNCNIRQNTSLDSFLLGFAPDVCDVTQCVRELSSCILSRSFTHLLDFPSKQDNQRFSQNSWYLQDIYIRDTLTLKMKISPIMLYCIQSIAIR